MKHQVEASEVLDQVKKKATLHLHGMPGETFFTQSGWASSEHAERLRFLVMAMAGEAGEAANIMKKIWRGDKTPGLHERLHKEIADTANYAFMIAAHEHMNLLEEMLAALNEYEQRTDKPGDDDLHWGGGAAQCKTGFTQIPTGLTPIPDNVAGILARGMMDEETAKGMARRHIRELEHKLNLLKGVFGDRSEPSTDPTTRI